MERLTERVFDVWCVPYIKMQDAINRLAAYEDTGLTPEEIMEDMPDITVIEAKLDYYQQAEAAGRLVVLPCKVGGKLWVHDRDRKPREMILDKPDIRCYCAKEDNLCMSTCDSPHNGICAYRLKNDGSSIGKTVFLTREEAEAVIDAREG